MPRSPSTRELECRSLFPPPLPIPTNTLKHWLRKAAKRSIETVTAAIGEILGAIQSMECANYFANAGYAST